MVTCPNCGQSVRESQRFCGTCGTDVQAALSAASTRQASEEQSSPYAYSQPANYNYEAPVSTEPPAGGRLLIIAGALILAVCCAFACGLVFGFEIIPTLLGMGAPSSPAPKPTTAPTPTGLLFMLHYWIV